MRINVVVRTLVATAVMAAGLGGTALAASPPGPETTYYLSLGDSAAAGFEPIGRFDHGYADQLYRRVREEMPGLRKNKLGCPGEMLGTMVRGGICSYPSGSQLREAEAFLQAHAGQIAFITIDIGANDWLAACFDGILIDVACTEAVLPRITEGLRIILRRLEAAAPGVPIAGMTYWNPFLGFGVLAPRHGHAIARQDQAAEEILNAEVIEIYEHFGAVVADVTAPEFFDTANFTDTVRTEQWGEIPINVAKACTWTWFCSEEFTTDVHPNTIGYGVVADALEEALGL